MYTELHSAREGGEPTPGTGRLLPRPRQVASLLEEGEKQKFLFLGDVFMHAMLQMI